MCANIVLTEQQQGVVDEALAWERSGDERPLLIRGLAGCGKSTVVQELSDQVTHGDPAAYLAPTNKAAKVLKGKLEIETLYVGTIHSAIYGVTITGDVAKYEELLEHLRKAQTMREKARIASAIDAMKKNREIVLSWGLLDDGFSWRSREVRRARRRGYEIPPEEGSDIIFCDEVSMVGEALGNDLMTLARRFGKRVVAIGDPMQLPPVNDVPYFTEERCVCATTLTRVMRQAEGSGILDVAMIARGGKRWVPEQDFGPDVTLARKSEMSPDVLRWADIVITGRNATRRNIITMARQARGYDMETIPQVGEPMIMNVSARELGITKGDLFEVVASEIADGKIWVDGKFNEFGGGVTLEYNPLNMDFAYAITAHKSQGSEYGKVAVVNESSIFGKDASKWLYTAVTRAREHLAVLQ